MSIKEFLKEWPVIDILDFNIITFDATLWEDETYTLTINFYEPNEKDEPPYSGCSICTQIVGDSLEELYAKIITLVEIGLFDGTEISAVGTLWDKDGNELEDIQWLSYEEEEIEDNILQIPKGVTIQ